MSNEQQKTHYRKVMKSDHLGIADLEDMLEAGHNLIFTIANVRQEYGTMVAGRKIDANIAYFSESIKPMVLNSTNAKTVKSFCNQSPFVEDWENVRVRLYIDYGVKMKGDTVGGVRISSQQPAASKPVLSVGTKQFTNAVAAYKRDGNLDKVTSRIDVPADVAAEIVKAAGAE